MAVYSSEVPHKCCCYECTLPGACRGLGSGTEAPARSEDWYQFSTG